MHNPHQYPPEFDQDYQDRNYRGEKFKLFTYNRNKALTVFSHEEILDDSPVARDMKDVRAHRDWISGQQELHEFYSTVSLLCEYSGRQPRSRTDFCFNCYGFRFRIPQQKHVVLNNYESIPCGWIFDPADREYGTYAYFHKRWQYFLDKFFDYFNECGFVYRESEEHEILFRLPFWMTCRHNHKKEGKDAFLSYYLHKDLPNPLASYPMYRGPLSRQADEALRRIFLREQLERNQAVTGVNKSKIIEDTSKPSQPQPPNIPKKATPGASWSVNSLWRAPHLQFPVRKAVTQNSSSSIRAFTKPHPQPNYAIPPQDSMGYHKIPHHPPGPRREMEEFYPYPQLSMSIPPRSSFIPSSHIHGSQPHFPRGDAVQNQHLLYQDRVEPEIRIKAEDENPLLAYVPAHSDSPPPPLPRHPKEFSQDYLKEGYDKETAALLDGFQPLKRLSTGPSHKLSTKERFQKREKSGSDHMPEQEENIKLNPDKPRRDKSKRNHTKSTADTLVIQGTTASPPALGLPAEPYDPMSPLRAPITQDLSQNSIQPTSAAARDPTTQESSGTANDSMLVSLVAKKPKPFKSPEPGASSSKRRSRPGVRLPTEQLPGRGPSPDPPIPSSDLSLSLHLSLVGPNIHQTHAAHQTADHFQRPHQPPTEFAAESPKTRFLSATRHPLDDEDNSEGDRPDEQIEQNDNNNDNINDNNEEEQRPEAEQTQPAEHTRELQRQSAH